MKRRSAIIAGGIAVLLVCCIWSERQPREEVISGEEPQELSARKSTFSKEVKLLRSIGQHVISAAR